MITAVPQGTPDVNTELHPAILGLCSLAAMIAANDPAQGQCQIDTLKQRGIADNQIDEVIELARHIRSEAARKLDETLDTAIAARRSPAPQATTETAPKACCTPTPSGKSCC